MLISCLGRDLHVCYLESCRIGLQRELFRNFTIVTKTPDQLLELLYCHLQLLQTYMLIWKRSLPKCNLRMAQGTRCLHAIRNYMRKVTLKYQHVHPPSLHLCVIYQTAFFVSL